MFRALLLIVAIGAGAFFLREEQMSYPVSMTLENVEGQVVDATVLGRSGNQVYFTKVGSSREYVVPVSKLSMLSRLKLQLYPEREKPDEPSGLAGLGSPAANHRAGMVAEIGKHESDINVLYFEMNAARAESEKATIIRKIEDLQYKIEGLRYKIARLDRDNNL